MVTSRRDMSGFRRAVLADTGVLYALVDSRDQNHAPAQAQSNILNEQGRQVLVTYATLQEAHALVLYRLGYATSRRWLQALRENATLLSVPAEDYQAAITFTANYQAQTISLHDFVLHVISQKLTVPIWTFDRDFDILRANVWRNG